MGISLKSLAPGSRVLALLGLGAVLISPAPALAQVDVVDSQPSNPSDPGQNGSGTESVSGDSANFQAELFFRLQALQEEVLELRGMVEEQAHELKRLKQRRLDDYLDLDRRIGRLSEQLGGPGASGLDDNTGGGFGAADQGAENADVLSETQAYRQAYQLLRDREIEKAIKAFNDYLKEYPQGNFAGNSHYWLGEIYLLQGDLEQAETWFSRLLEEFPDDRKKPDAQYKLGRVYHQQGKVTQAKQLLEEVASGASDAARLARQYLKENF